ncbi:hypothetical protein AAFF_G00413640 [Aldrovandia affinis]|uniref:HTH psq-type domain-containing protein n=1 Tax=Aldrovandia affinis TaxID=143900 RepID=A0AAD7WJH3_9TELE|nr:hypothetical protein AAFF_G00413640 [Aldrovandia affinis]
MATQCRSSKCTAERKGFRRELDSWRHKLVHCVGFESILEGIYGPRLLRDLSIFDDCEPDAVSDWSVDASCSFCNLQLDKLSDHIPTVSSPQSTPTEETHPQGQLNTENIECQADRFLHAIFRKKDLPQSCDPNIPLVAQELMKKMIHQFAIEYASKSQIEGAKRCTSVDVASVCSGLQHPQDRPLDLTVTRNQPNVEQADGVLDLSKKNGASLATSTASDQKPSGRPQKDDYVERSSEFSEGLLSKALKDIQSGSLDVHKAAILYGIPQKTLRLQLAALSDGRLTALKSLAQDEGMDLVSKSRETRLVLQKVASWARDQGDRAELLKLGLVESPELKFPAASTYLHQLTLQRMVSQLKEKNESLYFENSNNPSARLKIPQVRVSSVPKSQADISSLVDAMYQVSKATSMPEGSALQKLKTILPKQNKMECSVPLLHSGIESCLMQADLSPLCLNLKNGSIEDATAADDLAGRDKQPRKKRGRYRQYDHDILEEAITMVMGGKMSVSKAQGIYGVPHSTLEYKVKERSGTLKIPPKKKSRGGSPSPPPLSPIPLDVHGKISDKTIVCSFVDGKTCRNQPPSLFPYEEEGDALCHKDCFDEDEDVSKGETKSRKVDEEGTGCCTEQRKCLEQRPSGTPIQDLMERIHEKLKKIEPLEKEQNVRDESLTEPVVQEESVDATLNIEKSDDDEQACNKPKEKNQVTMATPEACSRPVRAEEKAFENGGTKRISPRRMKRCEDASRSQARSRPSVTQSQDHDSQLHEDDSKDRPSASTHAIEKASISNGCHSASQYSSPIRLMFVSSVNSENGIRYTLTSAVSGSTDQGETFDPCEESSWAGATKADGKEVAPHVSVIGRDENGLHRRPATTDDASGPDTLIDEHGNEKESCPTVPEMTTSSLKRKPGRPKKLGPQIEKPAKRPIGRPPKHKDENAKCKDDKDHRDPVIGYSEKGKCT